MFTTIANHKTVKEVQELSLQVTSMIQKGTKPTDKCLEEIMSLEHVHELPARYNCALMPYQAFEKLIQSDKQTH